MKLISPNIPIQVFTPDGISIQIDAIDYAIGRNADLGINEAGKTYAGGYFAEQLMKRGIPIVVISPSPGKPWRYLKIPRPGYEGYPVVVVGDNADLPLDKNTAADIMLAAMKEGVSIVFDLRSRLISKTDFRHIVCDVVNMLYEENENYGLRHVFLEEVGDLAPQRIYDKVTYGAVERFVREGGNSKVGVTMLNPRAENVNKEVLELASRLFLFQQTGRNSVSNLDKFFKQMDTSDRETIIKSFPRLIKGRCWYWNASAEQPIEVQIPEKETMHPDRRALAGGDVNLPTQGVDVSAFVARMTKTLAKQKPETVEDAPRSAGKMSALKIEERRDNTLVIQLRAENQRQEERIQELTDDLRTANAQLAEVTRKLGSVREMLKPDLDRLQTIFSELGANGAQPAGSVDLSKYAHWLPKLIGYQKEMLEAFVMHKRLTVQKLGLILGRSTKNNKTFGNYVSDLKRKQLIYKDGEEYVLRDI